MVKTKYTDDFMVNRVIVKRRPISINQKDYYPGEIIPPEVMAAMGIRSRQGLANLDLIDQLPEVSATNPLIKNTPRTRTRGRGRPRKES